jgi:hypothetical protein
MHEFWIVPGEVLAPSIFDFAIYPARVIMPTTT